MKMNTATKPNNKVSQPEMVDAFMSNLDYPLSKEIQYLRDCILKADKNIGEEILWNAPSFFYTGNMEPFKPKEYKRHIVVFNLFKKDKLRLIFLKAANVKDPAHLLQGDYSDGRRITSFKSMAEVKKNEKALKDIVKQLLKSIHD